MLKKRSVGVFMSAAVAMLVGGLAHAAGLPGGDGLGPIEQFFPERNAVLIGRQEALLTPDAAESLRQQLRQLRISPETRFGARYSVVRNVVGDAVIQSIYVFPPARN